MTRSFRTGLGFVATAALLAGCTMTPQPETLTVPNPLAAFNGILTAPAAPVYSARVPAGVSYQQAAPATYSAYTPGYSVEAPTYGSIEQTYSAVNTGIAAPAPTVIDSASYSLPTVTPSYTSAPAVPTLGAIAAPAPSYSTAVAIPAPTYSVPTPTPVQSYATAIPNAQSSTYTLGSVETSTTYSASNPTLGAVQPVQATGTTYDLTVDSGYGASLDTSAATGGSFQVVPPTAPTVPTLGDGVVTYAPAQPTLGGTLSY